MALCRLNRNHNINITTVIYTYNDSNIGQCNWFIIKDSGLSERISNSYYFFSMLILVKNRNAEARKCGKKIKFIKKTQCIFFEKSSEKKYSYLIGYYDRKLFTFQKILRKDKTERIASLFKRHSSHSFFGMEYPVIADPTSY